LSLYLSNFFYFHLIIEEKRINPDESIMNRLLKNPHTRVK
jgi:hypothetical protein